MSEKRLTTFFTELVTTQLFSAQVKPYSAHDTDTTQTTSLWLNQRQHEHLPFWKLIDVLEEEPKGVLDKLHHFSIQPNAHMKTLFTPLEMEWRSVLSRFSSKSWTKNLNSSHKALQWIWDQELKGFAQYTTQKMENVVSSVYLGEKDALLHHVKKLRKRPSVHLIEQFSRHYIKHLSGLVERIQAHKKNMSDPLNQATAIEHIRRDTEFAHALIELGHLFLPLYLEAIFLKSIGVCMMHVQGTYAKEGVDSERVHGIMDSLKMELNLRTGFIVEMETHIRRLEKEDIELSSTDQITTESLRASFGKEFVHFAYCSYVCELNAPLSLLLESLDWSFFIPSLSQLLSSRLLGLTSSIEAKNLPAHAIAQDDFEAFQTSFKQTWDMLGWSMSVVKHFIDSEDADSLATLLLHTLLDLHHQDCEEHAVAFLQSFLLGLEPDLRYQTFHALLILSSKEDLQTVIHVLGRAVSLPDSEKSKTIQHALSGKLDDTYKWWNSPHLAQLWATESRRALLKFPDSFWSLLFRDIRSSDISKSSLITTLLDVYNSHERERQLVHILIQIFEERIDQCQQAPEAQDAQLGLMSLAVHLKRRQFDCGRLQALGLHIDLFEKNISHHLKQALQLPDTLSPSSHQDWVEMCVRKLVNTLEETSFVHPPEFVIYPFTSTKIQHDFIPFCLNFILSQTKSGRAFFMLFSTLIHNDEPLQLYLATLLEKAIQALPKEDKNNCDSFLNHRAIVGNQAEKDFARLILDTKAYTPSTKVYVFNPLFELSEVVFQYLHNGPNLVTMRLLGRTIRDLSSSLIRLLPSPWNQHTQSLYRATQENTNIQQAIDLYHMHLAHDEEGDPFSWTRLICVNYVSLIQLHHAEPDDLPALPMAALKPLLNKENLFSIDCLPYYESLFETLFSEDHHKLEKYQLLTHLIPKDFLAISEKDLDMYIPFLSSLLIHLDRLSQKPTDSRDCANHEDKVISLLSTFTFKLMTHTPMSPALLDTYITPFFKLYKQWILRGKILHRPPLFATVKKVVEGIATHGIQTLYAECDRAFHLMDGFINFWIDGLIDCLIN